MYLAKIHYKNNNAIKVLTEVLNGLIDKQKDTIIVCIGTDQVAFDSIGPLVGTMIKNSDSKIKVYGELQETLNAVNIENEIKKIKSNHLNTNIIAIDSCVSDNQPLGNICIKQGGTRPGLGDGKKLKEIGDFSIHGIIGPSKRNMFESVYSTSVDFILEIAEIITLILLLVLE